jgi:hypothetical protein
MPGERKDRSLTEAPDLAGIIPRTTSAQINPHSKFWILYEKQERAVVSGQWSVVS